MYSRYHHRQLANRIEIHLQGYGSSANEVATTLFNRGVRGTIKADDSCPFKRDLKRMFPELISVRVTTFNVKARSSWSGEQILIPLPKTCHEFIRSFDSGAYRFLRPLIGYPQRRRIRTGREQLPWQPGLVVPDSIPDWLIQTVTID